MRIDRPDELLLLIGQLESDDVADHAGEQVRHRIGLDVAPWAELPGGQQARNHQ